MKEKLNNDFWLVWSLGVMSGIYIGVFMVMVIYNIIN